MARRWSIMLVLIFLGGNGCGGSALRYTFVDHVSGPLMDEARPLGTAAAMAHATVPTTLVADVGYLAAPERRGRLRGTDGNAEARAYITARLRSAELAPLFDGSLEQPTYDTPADGGYAVRPHGTNVGAVVRAADPDAEWIVLVAHYDHLGVVDGAVHAGADDNASSVALLLALGDALGRGGVTVQRHVVLLFPDAEEPPDVRTDGMGSSWFWRHTPLPADRLHLALVLDLMGGRASAEMRAAGLGDAVFILGAEGSRPLARFIRTLPHTNGVEPVLLSLPMIEVMPYAPSRRFARSDYDGLRTHLGRPFLFLTTGRTETYHTSRDTADTVDYERLGRLTCWVSTLAMQAAATTDSMNWTDFASDPVADARVYLRMSAGLGEATRFPWLLRRALHADRRRVDQLLQRWESGSPPTVEDYRALQLASVRLQGAMWRPHAWWFALW